MAETVAASFKATALSNGVVVTHQDASTPEQTSKFLESTRKLLRECADSGFTDTKALYAMWRQLFYRSFKIGRSKWGMALLNEEMSREEFMVNMVREDEASATFYFELCCASPA